MSRSPVVAICAVPGAGKSTLIARLKTRLGCASIAQDDFAPATRLGFDEIRAWFAQGGSYAAFDMSDVVDAVIDALKRHPAAPLVLLETHFGRDHPALAPLIGRQVWLDVPLDIALARQVAALSAQVPPPGLGAWLTSYLSFYQDGLHAMYVRQSATMRLSSDVVIDGRHHPDAVAEAAFADLTRHIEAPCPDP